MTGKSCTPERVLVPVGKQDEQGDNKARKQHAGVGFEDLDGGAEEVARLVGCGHTFRLAALLTPAGTD